MEKPKKSKRKLLSLSSLEKKAWKVFSRWIRDRDSTEGLYIYDYADNAIRCGKCFTCGSTTPTEGINSGHGGHFCKSGIKNIKFNERNVHLQCARCNLYLDGNEGWYAINLDKRYGTGTAEGLKELESIYRRDGYKLTRDYLNLIIEKYNKYESYDGEVLEVLDLFNGV